MSARLATPPKTGGTPTFTAKVVCAALSLPHGTLSAWASAGVLKHFAAATTIAGRARRFTLSDLVMLAAIKRLTDFGVAPMRAARFASQLEDFMESFGPRMTEFNYRAYVSGDESALPNDELVRGQIAPDAWMKLTIYPVQLVAELKEKLGLTETAPTQHEAESQPAPAKRKKAARRKVAGGRSGGAR